MNTFLWFVGSALAVVGSAITEDIGAILVAGAVLILYKPDLFNKEAK